MILYAESSAVLRWLLGAPGGEEVRGLLASADAVCASRLTLAESARALVRARLQGQLSEAAALDAEVRLADAAARWSVAAVLDEIVDRAAKPFPAEPVRTLDAIHLASALFFHAALGPLAVLSTDERVVRNARPLGLAVVPAPAR